MGGFGIRIEGNGSRIQNVHASSNGFGGIFVLHASVVSSSVVIANGNVGIDAQDTTVISGNTAS
jgi:hypothetical protein